MRQKSKKATLKDRVRSLFFSFYVARRYFFSKKSHNAVNIISGISSTGIGVGAMALICVLSVFNGFESLINEMFSAFEADLKITAVLGKSFDTDTENFQELRSMPSLAVFTEIVEESALLSFKNKQQPVIIKGVDQNFESLTKIDSLLFDGKFVLNDAGFNKIVPGVGVASSLGLSPHFIDPVVIYAPKRTSEINLLRPENSFVRSSAFVSGIFMVKQAQYDDSYVLIDIKQARELFSYDQNRVTAIELKLADTAKEQKVQKEIQTLLGDDFLVKNRYEQQESFYKIMKAEKWLTFLILSLILLIASFNIIGSLSMLIIEKKEDIATLRSLGADDRLIRNIFLFEGWIISILGLLIGIVLGAALCLLQQHFGFLKMGAGSFVENYPVVTQFGDILSVVAMVLVLGFLAAYYPLRYIKAERVTNSADN